MTSMNHERDNPTRQRAILILASAAIFWSAACSGGDTRPCEDIRCPTGTACSSREGQPVCVALDICGNGILESAAGEACDDGNAEVGDGCDDRCQLEACGNGAVDLGEACDDGGTAGGDGCSATCQLEVCGNGVLDIGEVCDDGNNDSGDGCSPLCVPEGCGNGSIEAGEMCDDGNNDSGDGCGPSCQFEVCGNGLLDVGETCDDGNTIAGDGCSADCASDERCGNGIVDVIEGEMCDDGNTDGGDGCSADCASDEQCGNGIVDAPLGEMCDDGGDSGSCDADCTPAVCGDSYVNPAAGEECDESGDDTATCDVDCTLATCGDGYINASAGEQCDDRNTFDLDYCSSSCALQTQVVAGGDFFNRASHTCALTTDGKVRCWGSGSSGQLGYGNVASIGDDEAPSSAGSVLVGGAAVQLAAGEVHTCALLASGGVRCWGEGAYGRLGYASIADIGDNEIPASVGDVDIGGVAVQIAAGSEHTCALLEDGAVRCWGRGAMGRLGYGIEHWIGDDEHPASAGDVDVGGPVSQIVAGDEHTCALLGAGTVRCWGRGSGGTLGYGNDDHIGDDEHPASAGDVDVGGPVHQLTAGAHFTCALLTTGAVRCWGWGGQGRLGYGNFDSIGDDETPASAGDVALGGPAVQIASGFGHTCALLASGEVRCWGQGQHGQLGQAGTEDIGDDELPASMPPVAVGGPVSKLTAGAYHSCAALTTGELRCWGQGQHGALGQAATDDIGDDETPASVAAIDLDGAIAQLTAGGESTCVVLTTGAVRCWGRATSGQLGYGYLENIGDDELPVREGDVTVGSPVLELAAKYYHKCALSPASGVRCWGSNQSGRLGLGHEEDIGDNEIPATAGEVDVGWPAAEVAAGYSHTCARSSAGAVRCWGSGGHGRLGQGYLENIGDDELPSSVGEVDVGGPVAQLALGSAHTCALLDSGVVRCWGQGLWLGYGNTDDIGDDELPASAGDVDIGGPVTQLAVGATHTCALLATGSVRCWGSGFDGALGYGNTDFIGNDETPASVGDVAIGGLAVQLSAGNGHTCALLDSGAVRCWGSNFRGQLGLGHTDRIGDDETPASVGTIDLGGSAVAISSGEYHACALLDSGDVRCWGDGTYGALGLGNTDTIGDDESPSSVGPIEIIASM